MLCPKSGKERSAAEVATVARCFPNVMKGEDIVPLQREWHDHQASCFQKMPEAVDEYWHAISQVKEGDQQRFPHLSRFAKAMLILPHASADVERHFSSMATEKTTLRNRMEDSLLHSLLTINNNKGSTTCVEFTPTSEMRAELPRQVEIAAGRSRPSKDSFKHSHRRVMVPPLRSPRRRQRIRAQPPRLLRRSRRRKARPVTA